MVTARVARSRSGSVSELSCSGHAAFDDGQGLDLVCAAVSALTGALGIAFTELLPGHADLEVGDGVFSARLKPGLGASERRSAELLLETVARALSQMAEYYPGFISFGRELEQDE